MREQFGLFRYTYSQNLGDEIQSIAAEKFLPRVDLTVERDRLHWYKDVGPVLVPFNGWFTHPAYDRCWPPPMNVNPIFLSWYGEMPESLITAQTAAYFKQYAPIGCRSTSTIKPLEKHGIPAYHSGCLTLTLPETEGGRSDEVLIVDADPGLVGQLVPSALVRRAIYVSHLDGSSIDRVSPVLSEYTSRLINRIDPDLSVAAGWRERAMTVRHNARMRAARRLLERYGRARLVITGLLHCTMPCLAMGTPVVLLKPGLYVNKRFAGLHELVRYKSDGSHAVDVNWENPEGNGDSHRPLAAALREGMLSAISAYSPVVADKSR